jgi:hypothetical protein
MEGLANGKHNKMCSITTIFMKGDNETLNAYKILVWRLPFEI